MYSDSITVCNIIETKEGIEYKTSYISDVFVYYTKRITEEGKGQKEVSVYNVQFSADSLKKYKKPNEYKKLDNKEEFFTLSENDYIILGEIENITRSEDIINSNLEYFCISNIRYSLYGDINLQNIEVSN